MDYQAGTCVLSRRYGEGNQLVELGFRPVPMQQRMEVALLFVGAGSAPRSGVGAWTIDQQSPVMSAYSSFPLRRSGQRITTLTAKGDLLRSMSQAETLSITSDRGVSSFKLQSTAAALTALSACQDDLMRHWGLDPAVVHALSTPASPSGGEPSSLFSPDDYPAKAMSVGAQGRAVAVLTIDAGGKPSGCHIVESTGNADLDQVTCTIASRGTFKPAVDGSGKAVAAPYVLPVRWVLPRGTPGGPAL